MKKISIILLTLIMMLPLVACNLIDNVNQDDYETDLWEQEENSSKKDNDSEYQFDIVEDDHTVIITIGNTFQVYTHDGVNVTGFSTYVDCEDADTAKLLASSINPNDSYYVSLGLISAKAMGKYLVQEYNEEGFPCKTYEELCDLASTFKQIKDTE